MMKRELAELRKKIISINQENISLNNTNQNTDAKPPKDSTEINNYSNDISKDRLKRICTNNSKFNEICMLMDINLTSNSRQNKKVLSQYNPISTSLYTNPNTKQKTKTSKQMSSVLNDIYSINHPSKKKSAFTFNKFDKESSFKPTKTLQQKKQSTGKRPATTMTSQIISISVIDNFYNEKKLEPKQPPQQFFMGRSYPMNTWFIRQNEKYKDTFYKETSNNIRNLVSYTDNKEINVPFTRVKGSNSTITGNSIITRSNGIIPKRQAYDSSISKDKSYLYQSELTNFSNKLFKKEVATPQNTPYTTYQTTTMNYSSRKDSLINNYQKILQKKVPIKKL